MKQNGVAGLEPGARKRITRRERFLAVMQQVVPWERLLAAAGAHWPSPEDDAGAGLPPLEGMLRLYFVQQWYGLGDEALEDALHDSAALHRFVGIELSLLPGAPALLRLRRLLEGEPSLRALLGEIEGHLRRQGLHMKRGSIVEPAFGAPEAPSPRSS